MRVFLALLACACGHAHDDVAPPATLPVPCDGLVTADDLRRVCGVSAALVPDSVHDDLGGDRTCERAWRTEAGQRLTVFGELYPTAADARAAYDRLASKVAAGLQELTGVGDRARAYLTHLVDGAGAEQIDVVRGRIYVWAYARVDGICVGKLRDLAPAIARHIPLIADAPTPPPRPIDAGAAPANNEPVTYETILDCRPLLAPADVAKACGLTHVMSDDSVQTAKIPKQIVRVATGREAGLYSEPSCDIFFNVPESADLFVIAKAVGKSPDATGETEAFAFKLTVPSCPAPGLRKLATLVHDRLPK